MEKEYLYYKNCYFDNKGFNINYNKKKFFSLIPKFSMKKKEKKLFFTLNYSNKCNLNCDYCYRNKNEKLSPNDNSAVKLLDKVFELIDKRFETKYDEFIFSFGLSCEPFLNLPLLKLLYEKISSRENYLFTNNDFLISPKKITELLINELNISYNQENSLYFLNNLLDDRNLKHKLKFEKNNIKEQDRYLLDKDDIHISKIRRLNRRILESKFKTAIKIRRQKFYTFWCMSNGTILNKEIIDFIKSTDINPFWISMDINKESHNKHRFFYDGNESFDVINKNIRLFIDNGVNVKLSTVITNPNDNILECIKKYQSLGIKKINITFVRDISAFSKLNLTLLLKQYKNIYRQLYIDILNKNYELLIFLSEDKITEPLRFLLRREKMMHRCDWNRQIIINSSGNMFPCLYFEKYQKYKLANIFTDTKFKLFRFSQKDSFSKICKHCKVQYLCGGSCKYLSFLENGKLKTKNSFECKFRYFLAKETIKLLIDLFYAGYDLKELYYKFLNKI